MTESMRKTFLVAYAATGIAQVAEIAYNYLLYSAFAVDQVGLFAWAAAVVVFFNMAVDLGIEPILTRRLGARPVPLRIAIAAVAMPRLPLIVAAFGAASLMMSLNVIDAVSYQLVVLLGAQSVFNILDGTCKAWLRIHDRQSMANTLAALTGLLKLAAIVVLVPGTNPSILELAVLLLVVRTLVSIVALRMAQQAPAGNVAGLQDTIPVVARELMSAGVVIGGIGLLTATQNRLDWIMVSAFHSELALAAYSLANKFYEISQVLIGAALTTIYPWLCRPDMQFPMMIMLLRGVAFVGALIGGCGIFLVGPLVAWLFGNKYVGIDIPAAILMLAVGFMATAGALYQLILARGGERSLLALTTLTTISQAAANYWLIRKFGISGAAAGMLLLVTLTVLGLSAFAVQRRILVAAELLRFPAFLLGYSLSTAVIYFANWPLTVSVLVSGACISALSWWILFAPAERAYLRQALARYS